MSSEQTQLENFQQPDRVDGLWPTGCTFKHGVGSDTLLITLGGPQEQRTALVGDTLIKTEKSDPNPTDLPINPLVCPELEAKRRYVLTTPMQAAWMYAQGFVTLPNETLDVPGLWLCFVVPGFEKEVLTSTLTFDDDVRDANNRFRQLQNEA